MSERPEEWVETEIGSDLWVDGLNVFLSVEPDDFAEAIDRFFREYEVADGQLSSWLTVLHRFCKDMAAEGEFPLYQALSVGMAYLSSRPEINEQMFNIPARIINHSTALLISPTYQAVWAYAYNAGYELYIDMGSDAPAAFRPEHGRIYQRSSSFVGGRVVRYPFQNYSHEMMHILLFHDLYTRVLSTPEADITYFAHIEGSVSVMEEVIMREMMEMRDDLNLIDDGYAAVSTFPEYGKYRYQVLQGKVDGIGPRALAMYRKRFTLLGEGELEAPDNPIKEQILQSHAVTPAEYDSIHPEFAPYIKNQNLHVRWAKQAVYRNRIPTFREVIELLPHDPFCAVKLQESLAPDAWQSGVDMLSSTVLPEPNQAIRSKNKQLLAWKELLYRLAEMRGFLTEQAGGHEQIVLERLYQFAVRCAERYRLADLTAHEEAYATLRAEILSTVATIESTELRSALTQMIEVPGTHLLEPR